MPPRLLCGVVHRASGGFALGAVEAGAGLEVELDVETLVGSVEVGGGDEPRRRDAEGELEEVIVAHAAPGGWVDPGSQCAAVPCGHQGQALRVALKRAILDSRPSRRRAAPPSGSSRTPTTQKPDSTHSVRRGGGGGSSSDARGKASWAMAPCSPTSRESYRMSTSTSMQGYFNPAQAIRSRS